MPDASKPNTRTNAAFPKEFRLRKSSEFSQVFAKRTAARDSILKIYVRQNGTETSRLGLVVSKKIGNAVVRNRWKRLLREAFRLSKAELPKGIDLVVLPMQSKPPAFAQIQKSLRQTTARAFKRLK